MHLPNKNFNITQKALGARSLQRRLSKLALSVLPLFLPTSLARLSVLEGNPGRGRLIVFYSSSLVLSEKYK